MTRDKLQKIRDELAVLRRAAILPGWKRTLAIADELAFELELAAMLKEPGVAEPPHHAAPFFDRT